MKYLPKINSLLCAGFLFLLITSVSLASDLIEPTRTLSSPAQNSCKLSVFSEPAGLDVDIDGVSIGKTPVVDLEVEPGRHVIRLKNGETEINAEPGKSIKLSWFKGTFINIPVEEQEPPVQQSKTKNETSKIKISEQPDGKKEKLNPLYWPLNPSGPIY